MSHVKKYFWKMLSLLRSWRSALFMLQNKASELQRKRTNLNSELMQASYVTAAMVKEIITRLLCI
jgi:hypothetical protein